MKGHETRPLARAILADRTYDIEFCGYLSNHAKHAIIALDRLQASEKRVQEYWDKYTTLTPYNLELHRLEQNWSDIKPASRTEWQHYRGQKSNWQEQVAFMQQELKALDQNTDQLVQKYAPDLLSGIAGALTHGIIHLGWAIDARSPWMICEGLAYLNFCHLGIDESVLHSDTHIEADPMTSFQRVANTFHTEDLQRQWIEATKNAYDESFHRELVPAGFQWQLAKILREPHPVATHLPTWLDKSSIEEIYESLYQATTWLYLATRDKRGHGNFVVLHALTSLWGLEQTCRVLEKGTTGMEDTIRIVVKQYYASLICLLCTAGKGFPTEAALKKIQVTFASTKIDPVDTDWSGVVSMGIAESEEHNIKLVYVMKELWNRYGRWHGYLAAAKSFTVTPNIGPGEPAFSVDSKDS
jgi:hypothetical protein